jgi:hypothetical protein
VCDNLDSVPPSRLDLLRSSGSVNSTTKTCSARKQVRKNTTELASTMAKLLHHLLTFLSAHNNIKSRAFTHVDVLTMGQKSKVCFLVLRACYVPMKKMAQGTYRRSAPVHILDAGAPL